MVIESIHTLMFLNTSEWRHLYTFFAVCAAQVGDRISAAKLANLNAPRRIGSENRVHGRACRMIQRTRRMLRSWTVKGVRSRNAFMNAPPGVFLFAAFCDSWYVGGSLSLALMALWRAEQGLRSVSPSRWAYKLSFDLIPRVYHSPQYLHG